MDFFMAEQFFSRPECLPTLWTGKLISFGFYWIENLLIFIFVRLDSIERLLVRRHCAVRQDHLSLGLTAAGQTCNLSFSSSGFYKDLQKSKQTTTELVSNEMTCDVVLDETEAQLLQQHGGLVLLVGVGEELERLLQAAHPSPVPRPQQENIARHGGCKSPALGQRFVGAPTYFGSRFHHFTLKQAKVLFSLDLELQHAWLAYH